MSAYFVEYILIYLKEGKNRVRRSISYRIITDRQIIYGQKDIQEIYI